MATANRINVWCPNRSKSPTSDKYHAPTSQVLSSAARKAASTVSALHYTRNPDTHYTAGTPQTCVFKKRQGNRLQRKISNPWLDCMQTDTHTHQQRTISELSDSGRSRDAATKIPIVISKSAVATSMKLGTHAARNLTKLLKIITGAIEGPCNFTIRWSPASLQQNPSCRIPYYRSSIFG